MRTIFKYKILLAGTPMPKGAEIIKAGKQGGNNFIWAIIEVGETDIVTRDLRIVGTGWELESPSFTKEEFVDTIFDGALVWHVFDLGELNG